MVTVSRRPDMSDWVAACRSAPRLGSERRQCDTQRKGESVDGGCRQLERWSDPEFTIEACGMRRFCFLALAINNLVSPSRFLLWLFLFFISIFFTVLWHTCIPIRSWGHKVRALGGCSSGHTPGPALRLISWWFSPRAGWMAALVITRSSQIESKRTKRAFFSTTPPEEQGVCHASMVNVVGHSTLHLCDEQGMSHWVRWLAADGTSRKRKRGGIGVIHVPSIVPHKWI